MNEIRVRFAPSPTGPLHIGGVRTALYNYLFAKKNGGKMILRIEDTDSTRFVPGTEEYIVESLAWLGIEIDEGVGVETEGDYAPYRQSKRRAIYRKYVDELLAKDLAYIAFDTPKELNEKRTEIANFQYDASTRMAMKNSLTLSAEEVQQRIADGENYVVRIKIAPNKNIIVNDLIRGEVQINSSVLDDKVLYKSADELPTYHLANVVDDHLMKITHVIRGEEWLPSAPLHVTLYDYLGWSEEMPSFAHLPLLLKPDGKGKLSKRDGDRLGFPVFPLQWEDPTTGAITTGYRESGYLPDAVVNFLALLGWNEGGDKELYSMAELIDKFTLDRVSKSGAKFDYEKAKWFNHKYIQDKPNDQLADIFNQILIEKDIVEDSEKLIHIIELIKDRVNFVTELWEQGSFFFQAPTQFDEKTVRKRWKSKTPEQMQELLAVLSALDDFSAESQEKAVISWIETEEYGMGAVMNAFRLAVVGAAMGPHLFDITQTIGQKETLKRLEYAIKTLD